MLNNKLVIISLLGFFIGVSPLTQGAAGPTPGKEARNTREAYVKIVENKIDAWEDAIDQLEEHTYSGKKFQQNTTPEEGKRIAADLDRMKDKLEENLGQLKKAEERDWKKWQTRLQAQLKSMEMRFGRAIAE